MMPLMRISGSISWEAMAAEETSQETAFEWSATVVSENYCTVAVLYVIFTVCAKQLVELVVEADGDTRYAQGLESDP